MTPEQLLRHTDECSLWSAGAALDVPQAYERALAVRRLRQARGEQPRGFKVGFTNRGIWPRYNVHQPIWGTVWDSSLVQCDGVAQLPLAGACQPRIEPECVFGLVAAPPPHASLDELLACVAWIAPGFEVVQSHRPDWKFDAGDAIADGGLHARLLVGAQRAVAGLPGDALAFDRVLAAARVTLQRNGTPVDQGVGANVLDGPLHALAHFVQALRDCAGAPELQPGDVVTTGTWTDAWPVAPGERWDADFDDPLSKLSVTFS